MIIYNTTYHVDDKVHDEVMDFFKKEFIPRAIATNLLREPRLFLIHAQYEEQGKSYSLQFRAKNVTALEQWMQEEGQKLQIALKSRFGEQACGFMTILEEQVL